MRRIILKSLWALTAICMVCILASQAGAVPSLNDINIRRAVEDEMILDRAVPFNSVDVSIADGVVTLTGTVSNLLTKERAADIAMTVKGVRSVVNEITVSPSVLLRDVELKNNIVDALLVDPATESFELNVAVDGNRVTLSGTVDSWQEKQLAENVVKGVNGVAEINNRISVDYKTVRPDLEIKNEILSALRWDILVDSALVNVKVNNGNVELTGTVGSAAEKEQVRIDAWVAGVKSVDTDKLEVKRWARDEDLRKNKYTVKSDEEIEEALKDAFRMDGRVLSFNITPYVDNGIVTLRGTVSNLKAKRQAAQTARNTVGVLQVKNRIKVRPAITDPDTRIESRIENALLRDPFVERYEINVNVIGGMATLSGTVDSNFEKAQADDVVSRVKGVVAINNNLDVMDNKLPVSYDPYVDTWYVYELDWYDYQPGYYTTKSDSRIKRDIKDEMWWSPFVDSDQVKVSVDNGVAHLSGTVDSWGEYAAATDNAFEGGATWVDNDLNVKN